MELQSGVVLAVAVVAVLLGDRIGGTNEIARKFYQVGLGAVLALVVVSGTTAFVRQGGDDAGLFIGGFEIGSDIDPEGAAERSVARHTIQVGIGICALLSGVAVLDRWRTLSVGILLGGLLLILTSWSGAVVLRSSPEMDTLSFLGLSAGFVLLLWFGFQHWEQGSSDDQDEETVKNSADTDDYQ
ncbi:MAG: hypothetical protein WEC75_10910 [Dehalococcoidia bacterium]